MPYNPLVYYNHTDGDFLIRLWIIKISMYTVGPLFEVFTFIPWSVYALMISVLFICNDHRKCFKLIIIGYIFKKNKVWAAEYWSPY